MNRIERCGIRKLAGTAAVATVLAAATMMATPAAAQDDTTKECVSACLAGLRSCELAARDAMAACREEAGCDELIDVSRTLCEADPESEECEAARAEVRTCLAPCKQAQREDLSACRGEAGACVSDECGLDGLPLRCGRSPHGR